MYLLFLQCAHAAVGAYKQMMKRDVRVSQYNCSEFHFQLCYVCVLLALTNRHCSILHWVTSDCCVMQLLSEWEDAGQMKVVVKAPDEQSL